MEGDSPIAILGFEDSNELVERNMDIEAPIIKLPGQSTPSCSPSSILFQMPIDAYQKEGIEIEGTKIIGTVSKPPAKITMNIPTFFPKLATKTSNQSKKLAELLPATTLPKKLVEPKELIKLSSTVTKPLITQSTVKVSTPILPHSLNTYTTTGIGNNSKTVISPTAVTISNSNTSLGIRQIHIPTGLAITKLGTTDPLESRNFVLQTPPDPLQAEIAMEVCPANMDSEPLLFDLNSLDNACSLPGCNSARSLRLTVFNFPRNRARRWCEILGIPHEGIPLKDLGSLKICGAHFDPSQFVENSFGKELKLTAMPHCQQTQNSIKEALPQVVRVEDVTPTALTTIIRSTTPQKTIILPTNSSSSSSSSEAYIRANSKEKSLPPNCYLQSISTTTNIKNIPATRTLKSELIVKNLDIGKTVGVPRMPLSQSAKMSSKPTGMQNKLLVKPSTLEYKSMTSSTMPLHGHGPKSQRKLAITPLNPVVPLGPYARPSIKLRSSEVKADDLSNLVMPSEDWSVNVYAGLRSKNRKPIYTISETMLNSDLVEIVSKSITIQSSWAMKFSVMSRDMSHFNLGLGASDLSDIQAVLDKFESLALCIGLAKVSHILDSYRRSSVSIRTQVERYVDNVYRSIECPLLLVGNVPDKVCNACQIASQIFNSATRIPR